MQMVQLGLYAKAVYVKDTRGHKTPVPLTEALEAVMWSVDVLTDEDLAKLRAVVDRENLGRSKLIQSQTKV